MKSYYFRINNNNRVVLYPYRLWALVGYAWLSFIGLFLILYFDGKPAKEHFQPEYAVQLSIAALPSLILLLIARQKLVFDGNSQTIYRKGFFGKRMLARFNELAAIVAVPWVHNVTYYKAVLIKDKHGRGIPLLSKSGSTARAQTALRNNALPVINAMLATVTPVLAATSIAAAHSVGYKYFSEHSGQYKIRNARYGNLIAAIALTLVSLVFLYYCWQQDSWHNSEYAVYAMVGAVVNWIVVGRQVVIDTGGKKIICSYLGIAARQYAIGQFERFVVVRNTLNGLYNGADIKMEMNLGSSRKNIILTSVHQSWKTEGIIHEVSEIINAAKAGAIVY